MSILRFKSNHLRRFTTRLFTPTKAMLLYQLMRVGSHFLIAVLFAKIGLSTAEIGNYEWMLWLGGLLTSFWVSALTQTFYSNYSKLATERQQPLLRLSFLVLSGSGIVLLLLFSLGKSTYVPALTGQGQLVGFDWYLLYLVFHLGTYSVEMRYLIRQDGFSIFLWAVASYIVHLLALVCVTWLTGQLIFGLQAVAFLALLRWIFAGYLAFKDGQKIGTVQELHSWLQSATPLLIQAAIAHFTISFDAWLLGYLRVDNQTFAQFRYASREFPVASTMSLAAAVSLIPLLSEAWIKSGIEEALESMKQKTSRLMSVVFPVGIIVILSADWLFKHVFNPDFVQAVPLFLVYMLLTVPRVLLPNAILISKGDNKPLVWVSVGELVLKVVTGWYFYHWFGLIGIAWSFVLSALFEKCALIIYLWRRHGVAPSQYIPLKLYFVCIFFMLMALAWKFAQF